MKKVLILTGDAGEALEVMYPYQRFLEAGFEVTLAAPKKGVVKTVVHDFEPGFGTYTEKPGYRVEATAGFSEVDPAAFDALYLPGGRAPEWVRNEPGALEIVRHFFEANKPVGAICHAALILAAAGVLKGRTVTAYPALKPDVELAGATFEDQPVVEDGNLVSARAWPDHPYLLRAFMQRLA